MKFLAFVAAVLVAVLGLAAVGHAAFSASSNQESKAWLEVGPPTQAARMTQAQVTSAVVANGWEQLLADSRGTAFRYGAFTGTSPLSGVGAPTVASSDDVWAVTVSGLDDPAGQPILPNGASPVATPEPYHYLTIFIDDATGKYMFAREDT